METGNTIYIITGEWKKQKDECYAEIGIMFKKLSLFFVSMF